MLRVIGAGLPRTGTASLKIMLETLLGGRCYHMREVYQNRDVDGPKWMAAFDGDTAARDDVLSDCVGAVDWPASLYWRELAEQHPEALVVLSHRGSSATWWKSANATVWQVMRDVQNGEVEEHVPGIHQRLVEIAGFDDDLTEASARKRYDSHFDEVVAAIPKERLVLWQPSDGWAPLCDGLGLPIPDEEPTHANTTNDFQQRRLASPN